MIDYTALTEAIAQLSPTELNSRDAQVKVAKEFIQAVKQGSPSVSASCSPKSSSSPCSSTTSSPHSYKRGSSSGFNTRRSSRRSSTSSVPLPSINEHDDHSPINAEEEVNMRQTEDQQEVVGEDENLSDNQEFKKSTFALPVIMRPGVRLTAEQRGKPTEQKNHNVASPLTLLKQHTDPSLVHHLPPAHSSGAHLHAYPIATKTQHLHHQASAPLLTMKDQILQQFSIEKEMLLTVEKETARESDLSESNYYEKNIVSNKEDSAASDCMVENHF